MPHRASGHLPDNTRHRCCSDGNCLDYVPAGSSIQLRRWCCSRHACAHPPDRDSTDSHPYPGAIRFSASYHPQTAHRTNPLYRCHNTSQAAAADAPPSEVPARRWKGRPRYLRRKHWQTTHPIRSRRRTASDGKAKDKHKGKERGRCTERNAATSTKERKEPAS